jgi:hypothetical protein
LHHWTSPELVLALLGPIALGLVAVLDHWVNTKSSQTHLKIISEAVERGSIVKADWYARGGLKKLTIRPAARPEQHAETPARSSPRPSRSDLESPQPPFTSYQDPSASMRRTA